VELSPEVVECLQIHRQLTTSAKENVGQLYSRNLTEPIVSVDLATRLNPKRAWRGRVEFDRKKALTEREMYFKKGWHCVGIWHTHPEAVPSPSLEDCTLARDYAIAAKPHIEGIVFVIVGTKPAPDGISMWIDDGLDLLHAVIEL